MSNIPRRFDARIGIGSADGPRSAPWRIWRTKNDVYLAFSRSGGVEKLSFHDDLVCRKAFTKERGAPEGRNDRATSEWTRPPTPKIGANGGSCVIEIVVPTNYLSTSIELPGKPVTWINAAPLNMAVSLELFFTVESEDAICAEASKGGRTVQVYTRLPRGEAFVITSRHPDFSGENFIIPASHHQAKDYIVSDSDPENTGRPARIIMYSNPKNGDRMTVWDYGAYATATSGKVPDGFKTLTRDQVLARN